MRCEDMDIVMPRIKGDRHDGHLVVRRDSPIAHHRAVFKIAQYFRREFHYDFVQYGYNGKDDGVDDVAYLWHEMRFINDSYVSLCFGAACFRKRKEGWALAWVWINPFRRRRGYLSHDWKYFETMHPGFAVEFPLSDAMRKFLEKRGHENGVKGWLVDYMREQEHTEGVKQ